MSWVEYYPAFKSWLDGDLEGALKRADELSESLLSRMAATQVEMAWFLGHFYFLLGKNNTARTILSEYPPEDPHWDSCWDVPATEYIDPDGQMSTKTVRCAREHGLTHPPNAAFILARVGDLEEAEALIQSIEPPAVLFARREVIQGELLRAQRRTREAMLSFRTGLDLYHKRPVDPLFFLASESLAHLLEQQGKLREAIAVLRTASDVKPKISVSISSFWLRNEWLLARLYRRAGDERRARETEEELCRLLAYADADHPILVSLTGGDGS